ncbi:pyrroline-5-carboxylate reductase [Roseiconus nitratireducens]|uniref:Pyrroline-5-carboxylate reductase n=1 Tax=Roseiconus nitratireducens TaxID=2605748 RepID=A0A5M6DAY0_9BACT|nr:pyrroline-5-carboxylate reductase [Roseiconus nitratireducens]KAA5542295.1 pyrroline-5-carboxylate reductase [Roseiconus nitratireducens]
MKKRAVTFIGGGQMGRALAGGMLGSGTVDSQTLSVVDPNPESRQWWKQHHADVAVGDDLAAAVESSEVVFLAVKPNVIATVTGQLNELAGDDKLVVSIAAGIGLKTLCQGVGHDRVVRVMPNTPSLVGAGASAFCVAPSVSRDDSEWIEAALSGVGTVAQVQESQMDAVTGLSGSGPAYVCLIIEALADGGVLAGLPRGLAMQLAAQTVLGSAKMLIETGRHPGELKDAVASPGGTTIAALQVLEDKRLRSALIGAVQASARRSQELGSS